MRRFAICYLLVAILSSCWLEGDIDSFIAKGLQGKETETETVYTVTFDKNGGDTDANPNTKKVTPPAVTIDSLPASPARAGHIFLGWNTQKDGSGLSFNVMTAVTKDMTVYAQWEYVPPNSYTVTFNKNNTDAGSTEANPLSKIVTAPATTVGSLPTPPARTGYTFNGWNTQADGSGTAFIETTAVTKDMTVYAQWEYVPQNSYTVTFNKNNTDAGSTEANPLSKIVTAPATTVGSLPASPARTGYTFSGWNTQANGLGAAFIETTAVTENITVYAQWIINTLSITYANGGGTGSAPTSPISAVYGTHVTMPENTYTSPNELPFTGWAVSGVDAIVGIYSAGASVAVSALSTAIATGNATITLTATWVEEIISSTGISMMTIPAGTFLMGSPTSEIGRYAGENQNRQVTLSAFMIGKYQVTQEQWKTVMKDNTNGISDDPGYFTTANGRLPETGEAGEKRSVEQVSWYDVLVFCNRLSIMEGLTPAYSINSSTDPYDWGTVPTSSNAIWNNAVTIVTGSTGYRLPTEAQWEYACRAGTTTAFNDGITDDWNQSDAVQKLGWYGSNSSSSGSKTHEVGKKAANNWGLYDMHGNVSEWCWDRSATYYPSSNENDPTGPTTGSNRVVRGGNWFITAQFARSASRTYESPGGRGGALGFRLVLP